MTGQEYKIEQVDTDTVNEEAAAYNIPKAEMAGILGVSNKTYFTIMKADHLDQERSDRFLHVERVLDSGLEVFGTKENLSNWLKTDQPSLDGYRPIEMMRTITGTNRVYEMLGRIKHGVTA